MLSRVASSVYWMSRYIERAENVARFVDVNQNLTLDLGNSINEQWSPLVQTTGDNELFAKHYGEPTPGAVIEFLTFDKENPNSILSCLTRARDNARSIREIISTPMWEEINKFYLMVRDASGQQSVLNEPYEFLNKVKINSHLMVGVTDTTMSHGEPWHFARVGRLLERADKTSRILDVKYFILLPEKSDVGTPVDIVQWSALLKSASALEMYRRRHGQIVPSRVADFLILDRSFPRSMSFCLRDAEESLHAVTGTPIGTFGNLAEQQLGRLRSEMDYTDIGDIISGGLHEFVDQFQGKLNGIGEAMHECFFNPSTMSFSGQSQWQSMGV